MAFITIKNQTKFDVSFLKKIAQELKPFLKLVDQSKYPFKVTVINKKGPYDRSTFDLGSNTLILKIDMTKQSPEEISWVFAHEFAHFLSNNNDQLKAVALGPEHETAEKVFQQTFKIEIDEVHEIFHDFLPAEVAANFFATLIVGRFHKRHPFKNVTSLIKGKRSGHKK